MHGCQDTKTVSCFQDLDLPTWGYRKKNLSAEAKNPKDGEKNIAAPLKRKQDVPICCSEKTRRLPVKIYTSSQERRYNCTSGQTEPSENYPCDIRSLGCEEKRKLLATIERAMAFVTTMVFQDGSSQLNSEQVSGGCVLFTQFFRTIWTVRVTDKCKPMFIGSLEP